MLNKIIKIENLGRFTKLSAQGEVAFQKLTLVYGENGSGKTTISSMLRSASTGNTAYVDERKTLGTSSAGPISLRFSEGSAELNGGTWSGGVSQLEIFDTDFVSENVYTGEYVGVDHRRNLYDVVVGSAAVALAREIDDLDATGRRLAKKLSEVEQSLRARMQGPFDLAEFISLASERDVERKLVEATTQLDAARRAREIVARPHLERFSCPTAPRGLVEVLQRSARKLEAAAEKKVHDHLRTLGRGGEGWLGDGLRHLRGEDCPFCGQSISAVELIALYRDYFSSEYEQLLVAIRRAQNDLEQQLGDDTLGRLETASAENEGRANRWKDLVDLEYTREGVNGLRKPWIHLRALMSRALQEKLASPTDEPRALDELEAALQDFETARTAVDATNLAIIAANARIAEIKQQAAATDPAVHEATLRRLRNTQIRQEADVATLCRELAEGREQKTKVEHEKKAKREELTRRSATILEEYESTINQFLQRSGASFRLCGTKPSFAGGKASSTYRLTVNNQEVDLGDAKTPRGTPCFRTLLSAGDKNALALAFFLARCAKDAARAGKVVVFDDPLSSLDCFRSAFTQGEIAKLANECEQVIVMSHDADFLRGVLDRTSGVETRSLQIVRDGDTHTLQPFELAEFCLSQTHKDYFVLRRFLSNGPPKGGDLMSIARSIRPYAEGALRHRFPANFSGKDMLGKMIDRIDDASSSSELASLKTRLNELRDINDFAKRFHHPEDGTTTDAELKAFAERALKFGTG